MSDRGIHPDLLEEEQQAAAAETPSPPRRSRAARAASAPPAQTTDAESSGSSANDLAPAPDGSDGSPPATAEVPEWLTQARATDDPEEAFRLYAANLSAEALSKNERVAGLLGELANRRARAILEQQDREARERQKREALANADFYGLGQLTAPEIRQQVEQTQAGEQFADFYEAVAAFQSGFDPEVQQQVQGKTYGAGKPPKEGFVEYLKALTEAEVNHRTEKELKRREPAMRKAFLSEANGAQPVPELDGGRAASVREITDEQVGRMTLAEYNDHFDENGRPRPGTRVRLTRAIDLRAQQR